MGTLTAYMWTSRDISLNIEMVDGDEVIVVLTTPAGTLRIVGGVSRRERVLHVNRAHIEGLKPGALGRAGLNMIGRKLLEEADVDQIIIEGSVRTTGRNPGRAPRTFRFPNR